MRRTTNGNLFGEDFQEKVYYPTTEETILEQEAICKKAGGKLTQENYVEICEQYFIETPTMPAAYN